MKTYMRIAFALCVVCLIIIFASVFNRKTSVSAGSADGVQIRSESGENVLAVDGLGDIYRTTAAISEPAMMSFPDSPTRVVTWAADKERYYAISLDGKSVARVTPADNRIMLRYAEFDPLETSPRLPSALTSRDSKSGGQRTYIVQFVTQPLDEYRSQLSAAGAEIRIYLPNYAYLVSMDDQAYAAVSALPIVRWVGRYEPAFKLEEFLVE